MSVAILYECAETDEMGIRLTAEERGVDLAFIPFRKVSVSLNGDGYGIRSRGRDFRGVLEDVRVVLNRAQGKNRRLYAANLMEALGKHVLNPSSVEHLCYSKFRTLLKLWRSGVKIPKTVYIPCDSHDIITDSGRVIHNEEDITDLIQGGLGDGPVVIKPDGGTHGKMVTLAKNRDELVENVAKTEPSIINPVGFVAQEFVDKWFFDLRIVVAKKYGEAPYCYKGALARAGYKDFRTNTYLGNMVFGVDLPPTVQKASVRCGEVIGQGSEAWVLALDAMIDVGDNRIAEDEYVMSEFDKLTPYFDVVGEVKRDKNKITDFVSWNRRLEAAYENYMGAEAYGNVKRIIEECVKKERENVLFHEANSCPEFWEQTRLIAGINLAKPLLECAESLIERQPTMGLPKKTG
ncbi:MAG: RimK family alpha-L-glutamate ligase [Candidatus Bathyarchaeia archaeon]